MKKLIVMIVLLCAGNVLGQDANDGFAFTFMTQQNESAFNARLSYEIGLFEPFVGSELRLDSDPEVFDIGCLVHSRDVVEPNSVPLLSDLLTGILNQELVLTGFSGFHTTANVNNKGSYFGSIIGIQIKDKPESPMSIVGEIHFNDIGNSSELDEANISQTALFLGLKWKF